MRIRSKSKKIIFSIPVIAAIALFSISAFNLASNDKQVSALSAASSFNAGNIIDDSVFYNKDTMSAQQIQDFLNRLLPNCDTWGTRASGYGNLTNAQYAQQIKGWHGPPYVCLNNYYENPTTGETSFEKGGGAFAGGVSAANIIYNAAQTYGINPQVLLVLLKKESAGPLTADSWPLKNQYTYAMGYGCPDTGPGNSANCNTQRAGFYKQMTTAAWQLKYYKDNSNSYRYKIGWNDIQYSPTVSCGTKRVNIENVATLSLYIYTPYTPNDGALNNYPGEAPCGAYGNRNFFMFFTEWFGSTRGSSTNLFVANQQIDELYSRLRVKLGGATSDRIAEFSSDGRVWQSFQNGLIVWSKQNGAKVIMNGPIYDRWRELGGSLGLLGVPRNNEVYESDDGRIWQDFDRGTVIWSQETGAWALQNGPINDKWRSSGGSKGTLGKPMSPVVISNDKTRVQSFEKGAIVRKDASSDPFIVTGETHQSWVNSASQTGPPTMDAVKESDDGRVWQNFEKALIIEPNNSQAWTIQYGSTYNLWRSLGGSNGALGKPVSNDSTESDGRTWQQFEKGHIIKKVASSAPSEILFGKIYDKWRASGGSTGSLGVPKGSAHKEKDGREWQDFENGTIIWSQNTGAWDVVGGFYTYWKSNGGSLGKLGKPTSSRVIENNGERWQTFEKGKAVWSDAKGWSVQWKP